MDWKKIGIGALAVLLVVALLFAVSKNADLKSDLEAEALKADALAKEKNVLNAEVDELAGKVSAISGVVDSLVEEKGKLEVKVSELENKEADLETQKQQLEEQLTAIEVANTEKEIKGYVIDELSFSDSFEGIYDDGELDTLFDGEVELDGENYDVVEEIFITPDVYVAVNSMPGIDEEFGAEPYVVIESEGAIAYRLTFDDPIPVDDISEDDELVIPFLGSEFTIISLDDDEMELRHGDELALNEGESTLVGDVEVSFLNGGLDGEAIFLVDGKKVVVDEGKSKKVSGIEISVKELIATHSEHDEDIVFVYIGKDVSEILDNGDNLVDDPDFYMYWAINVDDELEYIEVSYEERNEDLDDDFPPLAVGECISFPFEGPELCFEETTDVDYAKIDFKFKEEKEDDDLLYDVSGLWLKSDEALFVVDNEEVKEVFLERPVAGAWKVYYVNDDNDFTLAGTDLAIDYEDTELDVVLEAGGSRDIIIGGIRFDVRPLDEKFGDVEEEAESAEIMYNGGEFGEYDYDVLTLEGIVIKKPQDDLDNDRLTIMIPSDVVEATVVLR